MGKKDKSKKAKKKNSPSVESAETIKPQINFYNGSDSFTLPNGDTYTGEYGAHRNGMIWREGQGSYYTKDGHIYEGYWRDDKLIDSTPIKITYPNGDIFEGTLTKNKYAQAGEITFPDGLRLSADFQNNKPIGSLHIIDPMGQLWKNISEPDSTTQTNKDRIFCRQEQIFFNNIHPLRGVKKEVLKTIEPIWAPEPSRRASQIGEGVDDTYYLSETDLEKIIFAKKPKIDADALNWEDSPWYQHFARFKETRETILSKVKKHDKLSYDENSWYFRYATARKYRRLQEKKDSSKNDITEVDTTLLDKFYSEEHRKGATPFSTFYPTYYWRTHNEEEQETEESSKLSTEGSEEMSAYSVEEEPGEESKNEVEIEDECKTPNPEIACGTSSLFEFVETATGAMLLKPCKSVF